MPKRRLLLIIVICLLGCGDKGSIVYTNKTFEDINSIAVNENRAFCIILIDSSQELSKKYLECLQKDYKYLTKRAIYNIADVKSETNKWYRKWLQPTSLPLTCIFSSEGLLIDLIPGASKETFLYSAEAIKQTHATAFHWPNRFKRNKNEVIPFLSALLKQKRSIDSNINNSYELDHLVDSIYYPYSLYLKLARAQKAQDSLVSQEAAAALVETETPFNLNLYLEEYILAKKILDQTFDIKAEPNIRVSTDNIVLSNSKINLQAPVHIVIYNDGDLPLKIDKIHISCSCLELRGKNEDIIINGKKSYVAKFLFTPQSRGLTSRDIFIASNAINNPLLHINVSTNIR